MEQVFPSCYGIHFGKGNLIRSARRKSRKEWKGMGGAHAMREGTPKRFDPFGCFEDGSTFGFLRALNINLGSKVDFSSSPTFV